MNKDDIFFIYQEELCVKARLTWDVELPHYMCVPITEGEHDAKVKAIGMLWDRYANEIIAHIQRKTLVADATYVYQEKQP